MTADQILDPRDATSGGQLLDFVTLYDAWFASVYRWVQVLGGPSADSEDLVQEVFVVVQRKLSGFDGRNVAGWLYRITERTVRDYRRRAWFRNIFLRPRDIDLDRLKAGGANAEELLQRQQEHALFYTIVSKMSTKWRESFLLFEIEGLSVEEIATMKGIPNPTMRTHLHRARKEFLGFVTKENRS